MSDYASGKHALGICDRCGFQYKLHDLQMQFINQMPSGMLVCSACMDIDHEQLQLGKRPVYDPQALRDPRPDQYSDRWFFGWNPIATQGVTMTLNSVTVTT